MSIANFHLKKEIPILLVLLVLIFLIFFPIISSYYIYHDTLYSYNLNRCQDHAHFKGMVLEGRLLGMFITCAQEFLIKNVRDANLIRAMNVSSVCLLAFVIYVWLRINSEKIIPALLLSISICTLPPFLSLTALGTGNYYIIAALLSALAVVLFFWTVFKKHRNKKNIFLYTAAIILFLQISLFTNQSGAMFWWFMLAVSLTKAKIKYWDKWSRPFIFYFLVSLAAMGLYIVFYKIVYYPAVLKMLSIDPVPGRVYTRVLFDPNIMGKLGFFWNRMVVVALNLWNILPSNEIAALVGWVIFSGISIELITELIKRENDEYDKRKLIWGFIQKYFLVACLVPLSFFPVVVAKGHHDFYRNMISLAPLVFILLYRALSEIVEFIAPKSKKAVVLVIIVIIAVFAMFSANSNLRNYSAIPRSLEFMYIKKVLAENKGRLLKDKTKRIHLVRPRNPDEFFGGEWRYDELGTPTVHYGENSWHIIHVVLRELGISKVFKVTNGTASDPIPQGSFVVDSTKVADFARLKQ